MEQQNQGTCVSGLSGSGSPGQNLPFLWYPILQPYQRTHPLVSSREHEAGTHCQKCNLRLNLLLVYQIQKMWLQAWELATKLYTTVS